MGDTRPSAQVWRFRITRKLLFLPVLYLIYDERKNNPQNCMGKTMQLGFGVVETTIGCPLHQSTFVTFIIPSKGRDSIDRTIQSLFNQTHDLWNAVIVFDGEQQLSSAISGNLSDPRIRNYTIPKFGESNFAGTLRNYGMSKGKCSEWFAFVDDDDVLSPDYITRLLEESTLIL